MHDALQQCVKDLQGDMEVSYWKIKDHQGEMEGTFIAANSRNLKIAICKEKWIR